MFARVTIDPTLKYSKKLKVCPFSSAASRMMMVLAAPRMVRFPASVEAPASAIQASVSDAPKPRLFIRLMYTATNGTLLISWLRATLAPMMVRRVRDESGWGSGGGEGAGRGGRPGVPVDWLPMDM